MKKIIAFILFSQLFLLTACENTTVFSGESKDWKNKYVSSDNDQSGDFDLVIMYIGKEPAPAKINYEYSLANKFNRKAENLELKDNKVQFEKVACTTAVLQKIQLFHLESNTIINLRLLN